jgi:hypothetical protein
MTQNRIIPAVLVACVYWLLVSLLPAQAIQENSLFIASGLLILLALTVSIKIKRKEPPNGNNQPNLSDMQSHIHEHQD